MGGESGGSSGRGGGGITGGNGLGGGESTTHDASSNVAKESKLDACGAMHPDMAYVHAAATVASGA